MPRSVCQTAGPTEDQARPPHLAPPTSTVSSEAGTSGNNNILYIINIINTIQHLNIINIISYSGTDLFNVVVDECKLYNVVTLWRVARPEVGWFIGPFHTKLCPGKISDKKW